MATIMWGVRKMKPSAKLGVLLKRCLNICSIGGMSVLQQQKLRVHKCGQAQKFGRLNLNIYKLLLVL
jgi:hypothetical protein